MLAIFVVVVVVALSVVVTFICISVFSFDNKSPLSTTEEIGKIIIIAFSSFSIISFTKRSKHTYLLS